MEIKTTLRKMTNESLRSTLKEVCKRWKKTKDIFSLVRISEEVDKDLLTLTKTIEKIRDEEGFDIGGVKYIDAKDINNRLITEHGMPDEKGNFSLVGVDSSKLLSYLEDKKSAESCIKKFNDRCDQLLDDEHIIKIPKLLIVEESDIKKSVINADECYILLPFLDISQVGLIEDKKADGDDENESDAEADKT